MPYERALTDRAEDVANAVLYLATSGGFVTGPGGGRREVDPLKDWSAGAVEKFLGPAFEKDSDFGLRVSSFVFGILLLVDGNGTVARVWAGRLLPNQEGGMSAMLKALQRLNVLAIWLLGGLLASVLVARIWPEVRAFARGGGTDDEWAWPNTLQVYPSHPGDPVKLVRIMKGGTEVIQERIGCRR